MKERSDTMGGDCCYYEKTIPLNSVREAKLRRKWGKVSVNRTSSSLSSSSTMSSKMLNLVFMISTFNLICSCAGREIYGTAPGGAIPILASSSSANFDSRTTLNSIRSNSNLSNATAIYHDAENSSNLNWVIERKDCEHLDDGCFCESRARNSTIIRCRCDNDTQVAHLKPPGRGRDIKHSSLFVQKEHWTWSFEHCSKVVLHPEFLGTVEGSHFQVEFYNISSLIFHDSAFATRDSYSSHGSQHHVSIQFNQCNIETLPTKTFPAFLNVIKFTRCTIKSLARRFIYALKMDKVTIEDSRIDNIDSEAFYRETMIDTLSVDNSTVLSISRDGVASAINKMIWENSVIQVLQQDALSGSVANVKLHNSEFGKVESSGFAIKTWSKVILSNNTFTSVARRGIDLSHYSEDNPVVEIADNSWGKVERDFIATGSGEHSFVKVSTNTFLQRCDCGNTFASYLTLNGSRPWFHQEILNNSRCPVNEQVLGCLLINGHINSTESNLLPYDALNLLCDSQVYMCMNEVSEVGTTTDETIPGRPQLPNRLRVLAYFIAAMGVFIIASLLITMCVFLCRKKLPRKKSSPENPLQNLDNAQTKKTGMPKSLSGGEYADIVFKHHNNAAAASRPRSTLLEDVEMEDKGVQTMPTELSSEVLEGLREKLSRPDSFWDAKETIDHLYDLIQVKELSSGLSSPPDVTMCNGQSTTASTARLLPSTSSSPVQMTSAGVSVSIGGSDPQLLKNNSNDSSPVSETPPPLPTTSPPSGVPHLQRYAQIRNKIKTAPLCEYADPSDSSMHIYSELTPQLHASSAEEKGKKKTPLVTSPSKDKLTSPNHISRNRESPSVKNSFLSPSRRPQHNGPILCEYTEPKDVQTHVYAELSNNPTAPPGPSKSTASPKQKNGGNPSPAKSPISHTHMNTITIAVPPPPITIPHSSSFHNSPRLLHKIRENELMSSSNPSLATPASPVKIIHVSDRDTETKSRHRLSSSPSDKLKRSMSNAEASFMGGRSSTAVSPFHKDASTGNGGNGSDTQKRPLPSIPSWSDRNEGKSQF